jgi:hypothetical protein
MDCQLEARDRLATKPIGYNVCRQIEILEFIVIQVGLGRTRLLNSSLRARLYRATRDYANIQTLQRPSEP